jgi:glycosyltransferase involved in cell wall biosynthesis
VPDVRPYLQRAKLVVIPLRIARGIQNKVLEALASGKPIIASPQALEGLDVVAGEQAYAACTPSQWVAGVTALLKDESERRRLSEAGRDLALRSYHWGQCLLPFERMLLPQRVQSDQSITMAS